MARVASARTRGALHRVLLPLWISYLVRVYAWRVILSRRRAAQLGLRPRRLSAGPGPLGDLSMTIVFIYLWLPYMILPVFAGLERIPHSLLEASSDLGGRAWTTFRRIILPLALPALAAGLDLHVLADPRRLHHADALSNYAVHRQRRLRPRRRRRQRPVRGRVRDGPGRDHGRLPARWRAVSARSRPLRRGPARAARRSGSPPALTAGVPLRPDRDHRACTPSTARTGPGRWPIIAAGSSRSHWFGVALNNESVRDAIWLSIQAALGATLVALILGIRGRAGGPPLPLLRPRRRLLRRRPADRPAGHRDRDRPERRVQRRHPARSAVPRQRPQFGCHDHHRPRHVLRRRRLQQRHRPAAAARRSLEEASMDLGADTWQTFRRSPSRHSGRPSSPARCWPSPCPSTRSSSRRSRPGTEQTLPIWIFANFRLPNARPIVNVVPWR